MADASGLFASPDEVALAEQLRQEREAAQFAALGTAGAPYLGMRAGQQIGGLLGGPSPAVQRAQSVQDAVNTVNNIPGIDIGGPDYFQALSKELVKRRQPADAMAVQQYSAQQQKLTGEARKTTAEAKVAEAKAGLLGGILSGPQSQEALPADVGGGPPAPVKSGTIDMNSRDPKYWETLGIGLDHPYFISQAAKIRQENADVAQLKDWADPKTGHFQDFMGPDIPPAIKSMAQQLQNQLTAAAARPDLTPEGAKRLLDEATRQHQNLLQRLGFLNRSMATPEDHSEMVRAIVERRAPLPTPAQTRNNPELQKVVADVFRQEPGYRAYTYDNAKKTENEFVNGQTGRTVTALNNMVDHMGVLRQYIAALENGDQRTVNDWRQRFAAEFGEAAPVTFDAIKEFVAKEVDKGVRGAGVGTGEERAKLASTLSRSNSNAALYGVLDGWSRLAAAQMSNLERRYKAGYGSGDFGERFVSPQTRAYFDAYKGTGGPAPAGAPAQAPAPAGGIPEGTIARAPGKPTLIFRNGQWQPM